MSRDLALLMAALLPGAAAWPQIGLKAGPARLPLTFLGENLCLLHRGIRLRLCEPQNH
jgi:hypothetical protein